MVKKLNILAIALLIFFACISCTNKDSAVKLLYPVKGNLNTSLSLNTSTVQLNTEAALLLQMNNDHNKILLLGLICLIIFASTMFYFINAKHKKERFLEGYAVETRLSKKLHDEIANEIYGTIHFLSNDATIPSLSKEKLITQLEKIYAVTRNLSSETNTIQTGDLYPDYLKSMLNSYSTNNINIITKGISNILWNNLHPAKKIATYRSLQELMVNMKKHSSATLVLIDFIQKEKKIEIRYSDNGDGILKDKLFLKNGLLNIENRMNAIDGNMIFDNTTNKGLHLILTYPQYIPHVQKNLNNRRHRQY